MIDRLVNLFITIWKSLLPWVVVQPWEGAVLVRLGQFKRELRPGFHLMFPCYIDRVFGDHIVPRTHHITGVSTTTKDGKAVVFDAVITYQIADIEKALLQVTDVKDAIVDACVGVIGTELSQATWDEVVNGKATDGLLRSCRTRGRRWGIDVMQIQLAGVCAVKNIRLSTSGAPGALLPEQS